MLIEMDNTIKAKVCLIISQKVTRPPGDFSVRRKVLIEDVLGLFYAGDPVLFLVNMKTWHCCMMLLIIYLIWYALNGRISL
jgi:hypothetical protein